MSKTIKYIGAQLRWPELSTTSKQSVWNPGQQEERADAEADALIATGFFERVGSIALVNSSRQLTDSQKAPVDGGGSSVAPFTMTGSFSVGGIGLITPGAGWVNPATVKGQWYLDNVAATGPGNTSYSYTFQPADAGKVPTFQPAGLPVSALVGPQLPGGTLGPEIGGIAIGTAGAVGSIYEGFVLAAGDEFNTLDLTSTLNPRGKWGTSRAYGGGQGGSNGPRAPTSGPLAVAYDVAPGHTGWQDANRGVPYDFDSHTIVDIDGEKALRLVAKRQTAPEQAILATGLAGQIERAAMVHSLLSFWFTGSTIIEVRSSQPWAPRGQHPTIWGLTIPGEVPGSFSGDEYGTEGNNTKTGGYHNTWINGASDNTTAGNYESFRLNGQELFYTTIIKLDKENDRYQFYVATDGAPSLRGSIGRDPGVNRNDPNYLLLTNHIYNAAFGSPAISYVPADWANPADPTNVAVMTFKWVRFWRKATSSHYEPLVTLPDQLVTAGSAFSYQFPSQSTLWGASGLALNLTRDIQDVEEPFGSNASTAPSGSIPVGWTFDQTTRTLSGTMDSKSGQLLFAYGVGGDGNTCKPAVLRICVAPVYIGPANFGWSVGTPVSLDVYTMWDCGRLFQSGANKKGLTVTGLPAGLSFSATTGLITGTPSGASTGNVTLTSTNGAAQLTTKINTYSVAGAAVGGVAAPTLTGNPTLLTSLDFDNATGRTVTGGVITAIEGSDSTSHTFAAPTVGPTFETRGGKGVARFTASLSQYLQEATNQGIINGNGATFVVIAEHATFGTAQTYLEVADPAGSATVNRLALQANSGSSSSGGATVRKGSASALSDASAGFAYVAGVHVQVAYSGPGSVAPRIHVDAQAASIAGGSAITFPVGLSEATLGCRMVTNAASNFFDGWLFRVFIYNGVLTATNIAEIKSWAATNYSTLPGKPENLTLPTITGAAQVDQTLTANPGTWTNTPTTRNYAWRRNGALISGATATTYPVVTADIGAVLAVTETAINSSSAAGTSATSAGTAAVIA